MATGGGELFAQLAPFPGRATAVEGYAPNLPLARRRLEPLGVRVFEANTRTGMPFEACAFDLVLNRRGGFKAAALVYSLKAVPWVIKDFDVRRCQDVLGALHRDCVVRRPLRSTYSTFSIEVVKR